MVQPKTGAFGFDNETWKINISSGNAKATLNSHNKPTPSSFKGSENEKLNSQETAFPRLAALSWKRVADVPARSSNSRQHRGAGRVHSHRPGG